MDGALGSDPLTRDQLLIKLEEVGSKLDAANLKITELASKVDEQDEELRDNEKRIRSYARRTVELERKLQNQMMEEGNIS